MCYKNLSEEEKDKKRLMSLQHYYKNREKRLAYQKEYNIVNRKKNLEYQRDYYVKNKQMLLDDKKLYYQQISKLSLRRAENLRYQKAYYRGTNLDHRTWKISTDDVVQPVKLIHNNYIISFD
tara:strand:- start:568 stop:933 length:366 start_codon:yes stop_codon:yes gene_type:complete